MRVLRSLTPVILIAFVVCVFLADEAYANTMASILCYVVRTILWGDLGKAVATLGVAAIAASAIFGRASWPAAITVAIGITIIFGAGEIVKTFGLATC